MFSRSADQQLLETTTQRFLESECPLTQVRDLADSESGFEPEFWRQGAELGWTSFAVPEAAGGGRVSEQGLRDLSLVAFQFGRHAAPGPLVGTNVVAAALGRWGDSAQQAGPLAELLAGEAIGTWAYDEPTASVGSTPPALYAVTTTDGFSLTGTKSPVETATDPGHLLVTANHNGGLSQFLVPNDAPGLTITPLRGLDMTKRFARFELEGVRLPVAALVGEAGGADAAVSWLLDLAATIQLAESCGAMSWAFDTTVEWSFNRYSFGRPLASYQELKHRFADMKMWLEASSAITAQATSAVELDWANRSELVSSGKFYVGRFGVELGHDCVQIHGGIGVTFDHDIHLFLRRIVTNSQLYGSPSQHAVRLAEILDAREAEQ
jgi:alkylation response protein AidB-like acyl-CoA dehydrogenase